MFNAPKTPNPLNDACESEIATLDKNCAKTGLVLEGGAMRGLFTCGVLDVFQEQGFEFDGAVGVSAGACFGCNIKSRQPGRALRYNLRFAKDKRYCSVRSLLKTGDMYNADFCYRAIPDELDKFDYEALKNNPMEFYMAATDIVSGKPVYAKLTDGSRKELEWMRASASMPLAARVVEIDGGKYLDGGISDSIPLKFMESAGYGRNVVILTQPRDYVKGPNKLMPLMKLIYRKYPNFIEAMRARHEVYNAETRYVFEQEAAGNTLVICPDEALGISRTEHDVNELRRVYEMGRNIAMRRLEEIKKFLGCDSNCAECPSSAPAMDAAAAVNAESASAMDAAAAVKTESAKGGDMGRSGNLDSAAGAVLNVRNVSVSFGFDKNGRARDGVQPLQVTDRVSFDIFPGEFFALVGESGCGKSVTAMSILRLLPWPSAKIVDGSVMFAVRDSKDEARNLNQENGSAHSCVISSNVEKSSIDLTKLPLEEMQKIRGSEIACIFQEPMQALNPVLTIKKQLLEVFKFGAAQRTSRDGHEASRSGIGALQRTANNGEDPLTIIREQLLAAGFKDPDRVLDSYPHELSGGMLQRVCIVMALLPKPKLIIADEPTTALDVTVQAQVLKVLKELAEKTGTAVLLITHNMGIVSEYAKRVAVMYAGRIVECGPVREVIGYPMHPYTQGLLAAIPESHSEMRNLRAIPGSVPHPKDFVAGCRFADRCERCTAECKKPVIPPKVSNGDHFANCFHIE